MKKEKNVLYGPEPLYPIEKSTAGKQLYDALLKHSHLPEAMIDVQAKETLSYRTLFLTTCQLAQSLQRCGYKQNDVISICSENNLKFFFPVIAALYLGMITAPFNQDYTPGELHNVLNISKPQLIFCSKKFLPKILELKRKHTFVKKIIILDVDEDMFGCESLSNFILRNSDKDPKRFKPVNFNPDEQVAAILCSSGTTGLPKGVMLTHKNFSARFAHVKDPSVGTETIPGVTVLSFMPFFHGFGFLTNLGYFLVGLRVIMLRRFEQELFLKSIQDYEVRNIMSVPPIILFLSKSPLVDKYDLSSLKEIGCGAAPLAKEVSEAAAKRLNLKGIRTGYGLTEATLVITHTLPDIFKSGSSGKLVSFMSAKVIDVNTGKSVGPNVVGEICLQGDMLMKGYAGNIKATKEAIDESGWLHTGDLGYYTEEEYFYIVDRLKELIKYKGFQVAPAELEEVLLRHPCIRDAAVVGVPDETAGELPAAFVVKQPGQKITEKEVIDYVAGQISYTKHLRGGVRFIEEIPRSATSKIQKKELQKLITPRKSKL
ncbi:hypothetical protein ILUMI_26848 [Ignelater luminosus]|uniref:Luciferin 4-monooxygenase n=1 Tax=Ignelater luminosus TaxID=2038154 RepID=A0A8K0C7P5_IGNLU|nr:hypothetical protein ILUMI_26848 [Ignelater luminosus]